MKEGIEVEMKSRMFVSCDVAKEVSLAAPERDFLIGHRWYKQNGYATIKLISISFI